MTSGRKVKDTGKPATKDVGANDRDWLEWPGLMACLTDCPQGRRAFRSRIGFPPSGQDKPCRSFFWYSIYANNKRNASCTLSTIKNTS